METTVVTNGNGKLVKRVETIEVSSFLARIKDPQLKMIAKQYIETVNEVKSKTLDTHTASFVMGTYKELLNIIAMDNRGKKTWDGI